jgi:hypothetical protein
MGTGKWPSGVPREVTLNAFIQAFATLGYMLCQDAVLEVGFEKIAFYAIREPDGSFSPTHAAKQLPNSSDCLDICVIARAKAWMVLVAGVIPLIAISSMRPSAGFACALCSIFSLRL